MPISIKALRAYLTVDPQGQVYPTPQPIDLATDEIPYGSTVRFEVEVESDKPLHPIWALLSSDAIATGQIRRFSIFPSGNEATFVTEERLPSGLLLFKELYDLTAPPCYPVEGWSHFPGGEYNLRLDLCALGKHWFPDADQRFYYTLKLGAPPAPGGAPPRMVSLEGVPAGGGILIGQPWLITAQAEAGANAISAIVCTVLRGGAARAFILDDQGRYGDQTARDGIYSLLRVGGDGIDQCDRGPAGSDVPCVLSAQALDLAGNWSEPVLLDYTLRYSQPPLWSQAPAPDGPNIVQAEGDWEKGTLVDAGFFVRCDAAEAWVCGRSIGPPDEAFPLFDDGNWPDPAAGDKIHSTGRNPSLENRFWDIVFYAIPKTGTPKVGQKLALALTPYAGFPDI